MAAHSLFSSSHAVLHCAWLINPGQEPRPDVRVTVEDGVVTDLSPVPGDQRSRIRPLAVLPRFINAHTHLEFSDLHRPLRPFHPFSEWIRAVIRHRVSCSEHADHPATAIQAGWTESRDHGVGLIGEITTSEAATMAVQQLANEDTVQAVSFRELIGFTADRVADQLQSAGNHVHRLADSAVIAGLSPHAPYSVHPDIVADVVCLAQDNNVLLAMHLAETDAEIQLLRRKSGPFVKFLQSLNLWDSTVLTSVSQPLDYLQMLADAPLALAIHGNYLSAEEITFLADNPHVAVVYCPRTHAYFDHPQHPWQRLKQAGATVILGTDSRASNPDLSIWAELQHIARCQSSKSVWNLLPMITTMAATAMGQRSEPFTIAVGQPWNAVAVACPCRTQAALNDHLLSPDAIPQS